MMNPLTSVNEINRRQDAVQWLLGPLDSRDSDLRDAWVEHITDALSRASSAAQTVATLRNSATLCSPRRIRNLLRFGISLKHLLRIQEGVVAVETTVPELIHCPFPSESIDTIVSRSETFLQQIDTKLVDKNGSIAFTPKYENWNGNILGAHDKVIKSLKRQLEDFLTDRREKLGINKMFFKSLAFSSSCTEPYNDYLIEVDATDVELLSIIPKGA